MTHQNESLHKIVSGTRIGENIKIRVETSTIDYEARGRVNTVDEPAMIEGRKPTIVGFTQAQTGRWEALSVDPILGSNESWVRLRRLA
jgi:hypothetical protein